MAKKAYDKFLKMAKDSFTSEKLLCEMLNKKHSFAFFVTSNEKQKDGVLKGWHIPDIQSRKKPNTTIEVKEDISSANTGNIAFESDGLKKLKKWAMAHKKNNMFIAYINHIDYHVDFFQCSHDVDKLRKELEWLCVLRPDCKELLGGDTGIKLWIIPLNVARSMISCVTTQIINIKENQIFANIAEIKLKR